MQDPFQQRVRGPRRTSRADRARQFLDSIAEDLHCPECEAQPGTPHANHCTAPRWRKPED